jgi:hypothetical protein
MLLISAATHFGPGLSGPTLIEARLCGPAHFDVTGTSVIQLQFLVLSGTTSVSIASTGAAGGINFLHQLAETTNNLTTVTITGAESLDLGSAAGTINTGDGVVTDINATASLPTKIHSSLTLIDASATTGSVDIIAGATNTSGVGPFENGGGLNANVTITYTGLEIKGGSGHGDFIENDAKNGIVTVGNGSNDHVVLGSAGAEATLGTGTSDFAVVGANDLGINEVAGNALGDSVKFGSASTATLLVGTGTEAGSTAGTTSIGLTKVQDAAAGMKLDFSILTISSNIVDESFNPTVESATTLTAAENAAVSAMAGAGVVYFTFGKNEYFIETNHAEMAVSADDAIVKLVGVTDIHHATNSSGLVTLHV